jgi:hypothetical protein
MAMEAVPDSQTLHIPKLRRRWQVLLLQLISTASLLMVMKRMNVVFGSCTEQFIEASGGIEDDVHTLHHHEKGGRRDKLEQEYLPTPTQFRDMEGL